MLRAMRKSADNIFVKALLILLALSFASWGAASWINPGNSADRIAMVGDVPISRNYIEQRVQMYLTQLQQVTGRSYAVDSREAQDARAEILEEEVNKALLDLRAKDLGIAPGTDALVLSLAGFKELQKADGSFDEAAFNNFLRGSNQTKREFFHRHRSTIARAALQQMVSYEPKLAKDITSLVAERRFGERTADIMVIPVTPDAVEGTPDNADLMTAYKENESRFISPEYREFTYIVIRPEDAEKTITFEDADLEAFYKNREEDYRIPEKRVLKQYLFENAEAAEKGVAALRAGTGGKDAFLRDETLGKDDLVSAFREAVFAAEEGAYTDPQESPFGFHVYYVEKTVPEHIGAYGEVKEDVKRDYIATEMEINYPKFIADIEDKMAEGADVATAAASFGMTAANLTVDNEGNVFNDLPFEDAEEPYFSAILEKVFATEQKNTPSPLFAADDSGIYAVFTLTGILPERLKTLDEVRGLVIDIRKTQQRAQQITAAVDAAVKENDKDGAFNAVSDMFAAPSESVDVRRPAENAPPQLNDAIHSDIAEKIFSGRQGDIVYSYNEDKNAVVVAKLGAVVNAKKAAGARRISDMQKQYSREFLNDFSRQYLAYLHTYYNVRYSDRNL